MYLVSLWSFQHGFLDYVNRSELNRLDGLSRALTNEHLKNNSWSHLQKDQKLWQQLVDAHVFFSPQLNESTLMRSRQKSVSNERQFQSKRIFLLDNNQKIIIGPQDFESQVIYRPIMRNNRIVGYLGLEKRLELNRDLDKVFSEQQQQNFILIALGSLLIAIIIALPFSSRLIKPIRELLKSTLAISKGDYKQRVKVMRRDEIGQLSQAFNVMANNLEMQKEIQEQWITDISHELRTPLTILKAEIEAMLDGVREINQGNIESINQEINYLQRLVEDLHELNQSDLSTIDYRPEKFVLNELITESLKIFETEINRKHFSIEYDTEKDIRVFADKDRINQVLINLLQNNIRYCPEQTRIRIKLEHDSEKTKVVILWEDNGSGVNEANLNKLFDRLYREDSSRSAIIKGSGLGLSISKRIIENHQGSIEAFRSSLGGLGLKITLPVVE